MVTNKSKKRLFHNLKKIKKVQLVAICKTICGNHRKVNYGEWRVYISLRHK